ncbi:MAG: ABC transporter substrate-binding protein [Deltaproteobacteria bacterium]|nr:ABC transporter substrate-binding protein [Deltaproteobacteria bacterium]
MKKMLAAAIMFCVIFSIPIMPVYAQPNQRCSGSGPDFILHTKIDQILAVLENKSLSDKKKADQLQGIVDPIFNYRLMAKLTLGREYWPRLTKNQQAEFLDLFVKRLKASYFDKISLYSGNVHADIVCGGVEPDGKKAVVPVSVTAKGTTINMRYYFYRFPDGWKVYDVEIQGVSIVSSYKAQFEQVLSHGSVNDLLNALKKPLAEKSEKPPGKSDEKLPSKSDAQKQ